MMTRRVLFGETGEMMDISVEKTMGSILCVVDESIAGIFPREEKGRGGGMLTRAEEGKESSKRRWRS